MTLMFDLDDTNDVRNNPSTMDMIDESHYEDELYEFKSKGVQYKTKILKKKYVDAIEAKTSAGFDRARREEGGVGHCVTLMESYWAMTEKPTEEEQRHILLSLIASQKAHILADRETLYWISHRTAFIAGYRYRAEDILIELQQQGIIKEYSRSDYKKGEAREAILKPCKGLSSIIQQVIQYYIDTEALQLIWEMQQYYVPIEDGIRASFSKILTASNELSKKPARVRQFSSTMLLLTNYKQRQKEEGITVALIDDYVRSICPGFQPGRRQYTVEQLALHYQIHPQQIQSGVERIQQEEEELLEFIMNSNIQERDINENTEEENISERYVYCPDINTSSINPDRCIDSMEDVSSIMMNSKGDEDKDYRWISGLDETHMRNRFTKDKSVWVKGMMNLLHQGGNQSSLGMEVPDRPAKGYEIFKGKEWKESMKSEDFEKYVCPVNNQLPLASEEDLIPPLLDISLLRGQEARTKGFSLIRDRARKIMEEEEALRNGAYNQAIAANLIQYRPIDISDARQLDVMKREGPLPIEYTLCSSNSPRVYGKGVDNLFYCRKQMRLAAFENLGFMDVDISGCHVQVALSLWGDKLPLLNKHISKGSLWSHYEGLFKNKGVPFYKSLIKAMHHATLLGGGMNAYFQAHKSYNNHHPDKPISGEEMDSIIKTFKSTDIYRELKGLFTWLGKSMDGKYITVLTGESFQVKGYRKHKDKRTGKVTVDEGNLLTAIAAILQSFEVAMLSYLILRTNNLFIPILWQHDGLTIKALYSNTVELMQKVLDEFTLPLLGRSFKLEATEL